MSNKSGSFERETRDTIVKSGLGGVAATVLAVTALSPAGLGGMIGTSLASGGDTNASATDNPYANLPAYPAPLTAEEISDIRGQLAATEASMAITRAATEATIQQIRSIAMTSDASFEASAAAGLARTAEAPAELRLALSEPAAIEAAAPVQVAEAEASVVPVSYSGGGDVEYSAATHDPHLELAELFFAHDQF